MGVTKLVMPRAVLADHHGHFAGRPSETVGAHARVTFVGTVPKRDARCGEQIRNRHHRRTDNAESMFDPVHLENFDEGLFGGHFHGRDSCLRFGLRSYQGNLSSI